MTEQTEIVNPLEKSLNLKISVEKVNAEVKKRLKKIAQTAKMPGFRPGKVPINMIVKSHGAQVNSDVISEELNQVFSQSTQQANYRVAGQPKIKNANSKAKDSLEFVATFEVYPEITVGDLSQVEVEKHVSEVTLQEIDQTIEILRKQRVFFQDIDRESQEGDQVVIDFTGKIDGIAFKGGSAQDFSFVVGKGQMLPEFDQASRGLKAGESKTFDLVFPENYHGQDVAGKTAQFEITLKKVQAPKLPELNEQFFAEMGIKEGGIEKLREDVASNLKREVDNRLKAKTKESIMNVLLKTTQFDVPKALIESEVTDLVQRAREDLRERGLQNVEEMKLPEDLFQEQAERRVRLGLIVSNLVKANELQVQMNQLTTFIQEEAKSYENPAEVVKWYMSDRSRLQQIEAIVLEDNVVNWVLSKAKVVNKQVSFDELMGKNNTAN